MDARETIIHLLNKRSAPERSLARSASENESVEMQLVVARIGATDPDPSVRNEAADILGFYGTQLDRFRLVQLLQDRDWMVRSTATEAVQRVFGSKGQAVLAPLLNDRHAIVRRDAAVALGDLNLPDSVPCLQARLKVERHEQALLGLWQALFTLGERQHLASIVKLCLSSVPGLRTAVWNTVNELIDMGPLSTEELAVVQDRMEAARILALTPSVRESLDRLASKLSKLPQG